MKDANGVYVTLITGTYDASKLTINTGNDQTLTFSNDINEDGYVDATDAMIVYQLMWDRANLSEAFASIKVRLLADIDHDFTADTDDLNAIANEIAGTTDGTDESAENADS
jgi:hypothetical protein